MDKKESKTLVPNFSALILSIASAALIKMGLDPSSEEEKDMDLAQYNIDLLALLEEKTSKNLSTEEDKLIKSCIQDLRSKFVYVKNQDTQTNLGKEGEKKDDSVSKDNVDQVEEASNDRQEKDSTKGKK